MNAIHNARVQLLGTAFNNLGVASIVPGIFAPTVNGTIGDPLHISAWLAFGGSLMALAQLVLETAMSLQTYWLVVPLVGTALTWIGIGALLLTRKRTPHRAE